MIFNTVAHTCMHSLVNTLGESHKGVWVNKKLGRMMGLSICKHILARKRRSRIAETGSTSRMMQFKGFPKRKEKKKQKNKCFLKDF